MTSHFIDPRVLNNPMNSITGHTRLYRQDPPVDVIEGIERWFAGTEKKQEGNLQWARAGYDTPEDKLLSGFINCGNTVQTNVDAQLGSKSCAGLPVMVHYQPEHSDPVLVNKTVPYWIAP